MQQAQPVRMSSQADVPMSSMNGSHGANDSSFESFIDSNLILDSSSPAPPTPKSKANLREAAKHSLTPLSALPSRLSELKSSTGHDIPNSPTVSDYLNYPHDSPSSAATTPTTTSNSSSLHNLNFDFFEGDHGGSEQNAATVASSLANESEGRSLELPDVTSSFSDTPMQTTPTETSSLPSSHVFSWNSSNAFYPIPMTHSMSRASDDLDAHDYHYTGLPNHQHHHQRSLSLRDVAPPSASDGILGESLAALPFPSVKVESHDHAFSGTFTNENMPSPITEDRSSPASSSAVCSSLFEQGSPRQEKKRRLDSPSESTTSNTSGKNVKGPRNSISGTKKAAGAAAKKNRATNIENGKTAPALQTPAPATIVASLPAAGDTTTTGTGGEVPEVSKDVPMLHNEPAATVSDPAAASLKPATTNMPGDGTSARQEDGSSLQAEGGGSASKPSNKRPPPSASQITESGQPFPVIDTSAKHSSLFVPPDTSGLTKREARLVKNRAAAFLSRQRKREQFEELEIKCKSLCRLVWRFWEIVAGPNHEIAFADKYNQTKILPIVLEEELEDVKEVLEMVVALKGGSVAPTEDGQLQGAVAAGIKSANGKIVGTPGVVPGSNSNVSVTTSTTAEAQPVAGVNVNEGSEVARLQAELRESRKREAQLQTDLARERSLRINNSYGNSLHNNEATKPFKGGKEGDAISLTITPSYEEGEENDEENLHDAPFGMAARKRSGRNRMPPPRTSERLLRQQNSQGALIPAGAAANGGQRKAAGAALMMVLFSFALFGLPSSGQMPRVGGITQVGSTAKDFSAGKVLGAPLSGAQFGAEDDDEMGEHDGKQAPSSHLSAKDLLPSIVDTSDMLNFDDASHDDGESASEQERLHQSFQEVLRGASPDGRGENTVDYRAFAKDLGASLDWDVQRGFLVIGSDHEDEAEGDNDEREHLDESKEKTSKSRSVSGKDDKTGEAPTKLTLFVPAPDLHSENMEGEDCFYDAPLASFDATATGTKGGGEEGRGRGKTGDESGSSTPRDLTQAEATKAALRVLRNHRIAQEAAALATTRRLSKKPDASSRVSSPRSVTATLQSQETLATGDGMDNQKKMTTTVTKDSSSDAANSQEVKMDLETDGEEEQDYSKDVMDASSATDKIRGTDFYQLEFSLSGAKVRNVAELAKLLRVIRNKNE